MIQRFFSVMTAFAATCALLAAAVSAQTTAPELAPRGDLPGIDRPLTEGAASAQTPAAPIAPAVTPHNNLARRHSMEGSPRAETPATSITPVLTQHNDLSRTGQYLTETTLTPSNVNSATFGKVFSYSVDGQMYAQPLYVPDVTIGGTSHNVVYVATENDTVYAFDADGKSATPLWQVSYLNSTASLSVTPVPCGTDGNSTDISCNVFPYYGITGTPVINLATESPATGTMYFVVRTQETPTSTGIPAYYQRLHAVDITTGKDVANSPAVISGSVSGTGAGSDGVSVTYDPLADIQRAALTLVNGTVYIGWAGAAHGWIMGYDATTLAQTEIFNTAPNSVLGGVWQTGNGFVADSAGNLYVAVGDTLFDGNTGGIDYGDTLLKLTPNPATGFFDVADYFTPDDQACRAPNDLDLGSSGPVLLPTQGGAVPNELLVTGKSGYGIPGCDTLDLYLLNLDDLGQYNATKDNVLQELTDPPITAAPNSEPQGFWSSAAFWQGTENAEGTSGTSYVYMAGTSALDGYNGGAPLDQYSINGVTSGTAVLSTTPVQSMQLFEQGATPSISSNGITDGIVWVIERIDSLDAQPGDMHGVLWAYDATNVTRMLYNSSQMTNNRDQLGCANKFQTPTIANGRVYVGTQTQLDVYGLLSTLPPTAPAIAIDGVCNTFPTVNNGQRTAPWVSTITNIGNETLSFSGIKITGPNSSDFRLTNKCGTTLAATKSCSISVTFAPTLGVPEIAYVTISDNAAGSPHNIRVIGTGNGPTVVVTPPFLTYGKQDVGIAASQTVTVANAGNVTAIVTGVNISGTNANLFSETNDCGEITVTGSTDTCTINVTFTPLVTGQFSASLNILDNAGGPQQISLTGVGVQPNAVITSPNPPVINFGSVAVGSASSALPVNLTNNGGGTLFVSSINFTGPNPGDYSETDNCSPSVPSQGTCTINVTFKPTANGTRQADLNVNDNSTPSPQQVSLSGDGT